ncbi:MAG: cation diffusion facilitator family transporter [Firmicutes bacterium]|nr:cation diffusion facilitator family transporter [Bacillota bacterium]
MEKEVRYKKLRKVTRVTLVSNIFLAIAKVVIGVISGSTALVTDAVHTFVDGFTTIGVMIGLKFSKNDADKEHQYGHQRVESIVSLLISVVLLVVAGLLGWEGISSIIAREQIEPSIPAVIVIAMSILLKGIMFKYAKGTAVKLDSSALLGDALHIKADVLSSIAALIGVLGAFFGFYILDPIGALIVCLFILKAAYDIFVMAVNQLMDKAADDETVENIRNLALSADGVINIDLLKTRLSNNIIFVEMEILVNSEISVAEGHKIAENVHNLIEENIKNIGHCMVHVNPTTVVG